MNLPTPPPRALRDLAMRFSSPVAQWLAETACRYRTSTPAVVRASIEVARGQAATVREALSMRSESDPVTPRVVASQLASWPANGGGCVEVHDMAVTPTLPKAWGRFCVVRWPPDDGPPDEMPVMAWHSQLEPALEQGEAWWRLPPGVGPP